MLLLLLLHNDGALVVVVVGEEIGFGTGVSLVGFPIDGTTTNGVGPGDWGLGVVVVVVVSDDGDRVTRAEASCWVGSNDDTGEIDDPPLKDGFAIAGPLVVGRSEVCGLW